MAFLKILTRCNRTELYILYANDKVGIVQWTLIIMETILSFLFTDTAQYDIKNNLPHLHIYKLPHYLGLKTRQARGSIDSCCYQRQQQQQSR